ncbi:ribosome small subunit-dependent GTPase A [Sporosalibacterium faouarense]|uniref:ribosome small subunit-dependent GTPase A n=1 Tax=Sporosalibacterium faouarense TaxID=516123 RepID=UPI001FAED9EB|nr:ribosome small subunit-dependent GTPase A [Sporosalibacterium faouarense]
MNIKEKISLEDLGWNKGLQTQLEEFNIENDCEYKIGRVAVEYKGLYKIFTSVGEILGAISGKMQHNAIDREDYPAVGDWVIIDRTDQKTGNAIIHSIFPRKSKFSRKIAGNQAGEQIIATNVDYLFICMSLNKDFNLRRLERYLIMAWEGGANPVVLLTKSDISDNIDERINDVESVAFGVNVHVVSSVTGDGIDEIYQYIDKGTTIAFIGSSGVGKSTLINYLAGEEKLETRDIREGDDKGKHTTTHRELILLKDKGIVIDTPGMRELHILDAESGIDNTFSDIEELAAKCKFNDCKHDSEPGCAIKGAIDNGSLSENRFANYLKLQREAEYIQRKNKLKEMKVNKREKRK